MRLSLKVEHDIWGKIDENQSQHSSHEILTFVHGEYIVL